MKPSTILTVSSLALVAVLSAVPMTSIPAQAAGMLDRTVLPIPEPKRPVITELDARKVMPPP
ncbi:MAG: hypothetical protein NTZ28_00785, partial [Nitrospirae bacterium]|nr:hypothetical protein [Nitrospirota bacterium]